MSLMLNTGAMQYKADGSSGWQPLTLVANVDLASLADVFSESSTYEVGEYVRRGGIMYRCITAVTTAGAWDSTKWTEVNIADELNNRVLKSGDTMTGELTIERSGNVEYLKVKNTELAVTDTPSTNTYNSIVFTDKNDTVLGVVRLGYMSSGNHEIQFRASNGTTNNDLHIRVKGDGTPDIGMTSSAAWRNTLGLGTSGEFPITIAQGGTGQTEVTDITTISQIVTAGTNISITEAFYDYWGKLAYLSMIVKANAAISSGATIATVVSGKRPRRAIYGQDSTNGLISIGASGAVQTQHTIASGNSLTIRVTYLLP